MKGAAFVKMLISGQRLLLIVTISLILHQVRAEEGSENGQEETIKENLNSSEESQEVKSKNKGESEGKDKDNQEEEKEREEYWDPPPYEDLYCGHMNCYDLLGVTR